MQISRKQRQWLLILILLIAFAVRVLALTDVPPGLSGDEGINGSDAMRISETYHPLFFTQNFGREPFYVYTVAALFKLIGASAFILRYTSVLYGMLGIAAIYAMVKQVWNSEIALLTTILVTVSFWSLFISRVGLRSVTMLPLQAIAIFALWRGLHTKIWHWWAITTVSLGTLFYTYIPGRIFPLFIIGWLLFLATFGGESYRSRVTSRWHLILLTTIGTLLVIGPLVWFISQFPETANQRLTEVGGTMEALKQGDLAPTLQGIWKTVQMFTWRGDPNIRYSIPERPLFDWLMGFFFFFGFMVTLWRWRQPRYQLLLIWLSIMLLPTILSDRTPSVLRATGALIPVYILPAIGMYQLRRKLSHFAIKHGSRIALALIIAALALHTIRSTNDYFIQWSADPNLHSIYGDRLSRLADELDKLLPLPDESEVLVTCYYATHICEDMIRLQSKYEGTIRSFAGYAGIFLPPVSNNTADLVYLFGHALPLSPAAADLLTGADQLHWQVSPEGEPETAVYRLSSANIAARELSGFGGENGRFYSDSLQIELLGYDLPQTAPRGEKINLLLYWRVPDNFVNDQQESPRWQLTLLDDQENQWVEVGDILPHESTVWQPGDFIVQPISLRVPVTLPPGTATLHLGIYRADSILMYQSRNGQLSRTLALESIQVGGVVVQSAPTSSLSIGIEGDLLLTNQTVADHVAPSNALFTSWDWVANVTPSVDYALRFQLHQNTCDGAVLFDVVSPIWPDRYPTSRWQAGEPIRSIHTPAIPPDFENGTYWVSVELMVPDNAVAFAPQSLYCESLVVDGRSHQFEQPEIQVMIERPFADGIVLSGYSVTPPLSNITDGDTFEIINYWQATQTPLHAYTAFVHVYDANGNIVGQHDSLPCFGGCITTSWLPDEYIADVHPITINQESTSESYSLGFGLYDPVTFARLSTDYSEDNVIIVPLEIEP